MKKLGVPVAVLIAAGVVLAALAGALVASSLSDDSDDEDVVVTTVAPAANAGLDDDDQIEPATEPEDVPLHGAEAKRVAAAAIEAAGGGTVTELSRSDDPGEAYEVEVMTDAGEVDIALDENLNRVSNSSPYDDDPYGD